MLRKGSLVMSTQKRATVRPCATVMPNVVIPSEIVSSPEHSQVGALVILQSTVKPAILVS